MLRSMRHKMPHHEPRPPFERLALVLQGGGALGAYQGGVYQALAEANLHPDWISGVSIGAINAALIAGNPAEKRVESLRQFWETVSASPFGFLFPWGIDLKNEYTYRIVNQIRSLGTLSTGAPGFFAPRIPPPFVWPPERIDTVSYYDLAPLKSTLERLVDLISSTAGRRA
jgi:NTE family protein